MSFIAFVVEKRDAGLTLAAFLRQRLGLTWSRTKRLIERRHVRVSGQVEVNAARRLKAGKRVEVAAGVLPPHTQKATSDRPSHSDNLSPSQRPAGGSAKGSRAPTPSPPPRPPIPTPSDSASPRSGKAQTATSSGKTNRSHDRLIIPGNPSSGPPSALRAELVEPEIIYADEAVVVVNKPAGLTTMRHPHEVAEFGQRARRYLPQTLADLLPPLLQAPRRKVFAVHRLDRDTSGLVVFARTLEAAMHLAQQFRRHTVDRRYLALTRGVPPEGRIVSWIVRDRGDGRRGSCPPPPPPGARQAITHVRVLATWGQYAQVECRLETGRTHQVRIHLGEAGAPLCGERIYDRPLHGRPFPDNSGAQRPMLHAARLGFRHPSTGEDLLWEVPPPKDFLETLERIQKMLVN